jgi:hypothetical protein
MTAIMDWIGKLPTTNARIAITLLLAVATGIRYEASNLAFFSYVVAPWSPSLEWLGFLIAMAGLDVAQFTSKRFTEVSYVNAKTGTPTDPAAPATAPPSS